MVWPLRNHEPDPRVYSIAGEVRVHAATHLLDLHPGRRSIRLRDLHLHRDFAADGLIVIITHLPSAWAGRSALPLRIGLRSPAPTFHARLGSVAEEERILWSKDSISLRRCSVPKQFSDRTIVVAVSDPSSPVTIEFSALVEEGGLIR